MLRLLDVGLEIGRGLGFVRSTSFVEEMETLVFRYTSSLLATALKLLQYLFFGLALLTSATAIYAVAYQLIMPTKLHEKELFFDYFPPAVGAVGAVGYGRGGVGSWPEPPHAAAAAASAGACATGAGVGYGSSSFNSPEAAAAAAAHPGTMMTGENAAREPWVPPPPSAPPAPQGTTDPPSPSSSSSSQPSNTCVSPNPSFFPPSSSYHPFPHASVDFLSKYNQWHASPLTKTDPPLDRILRPDRVYVIDIEISLPDSEPNVFLGNFMVSVDLCTRENELLARSARPLILLYRSYWVRVMRSLFLSPFWALGLSQEAQVMRVTLFDRFRESGAHPMARARVTLSSSQVHVYKAALSITAQLNWLQFVMSYYFYSTAFLAIFLLATMLAAVVGFVYVWTELEGEEEEARQGGREDEDGWGNGGRYVAVGSGGRGRGGGRGREGGGFGVVPQYQHQNAANDETDTLLGADGGREGGRDRGEGRAMVQVAERGSGGEGGEGEGGGGGGLSSPASMTTRSVFLVDDDGGQVEGGRDRGGGAVEGGSGEEPQTISGSPTVVPMSSNQTVTLTGGGMEGGGEEPQPQQSQGVRRRGQHLHHHHHHHHQHGQGDEDDDEEFLLGATSN